MLLKLLRWLISVVVEHVITPILMPLVNRNLVPDFLIRFGVRMSLAGRLRTIAVKNTAVDRERIAAFVADLKTRPIAENTADANDQHYEVPPEFYQYSLGDYRKYSAGLWVAPDTTLTESEFEALELVCKRAQLEDGQKVLELGCGWGSFTLYAATKYPGSQFTCVSNSASQRRYIEAEAARRGLNNVTPITADMNTFAAPHTVDRIVSIEMFEHMKNYQLLFQRVSEWLNPGGKLFVHIFSHVGQPYHFLTEDGWMAQNFFTGGTMPSDDLFLYFQDHLSVEGHWRIDGRHYARTCNEWLKLMDRNKAKVLPIISETYPDAKADPTKRYVMWRLFYIACAELFDYNGGQEWVVSHYRFTKRA